MSASAFKSKNSIRSQSSDVSIRKARGKDSPNAVKQNLLLTPFKISPQTRNERSPILQENKSKKTVVKIVVKKGKLHDKHIHKQISKKADLLRESNEKLKELKIKESEKAQKTEQVVYELSKQLNNEQSRNMFITKDITESTQQRNRSTEKAFSLVEYSNTFKERWNDFAGTVRNFEQTIKGMKEKNEKLRSEYETKCNELEGALVLLYEKIQEDLKLTKERERRIRELEVHAAQCSHEINEQRIMFQEQENLNAIRNKEKENTNIHLAKKLYDLTNFADNTKKKSKEQRRNLRKNERGKDYLEMKISEVMCKNDLLRKEVENLTLKLNKPRAPSLMKRNKSVSFFQRGN